MLFLYVLQLETIIHSVALSSPRPWFGMSLCSATYRRTAVTVGTAGLIDCIELLYNKRQPIDFIVFQSIGRFHLANESKYQMICYCRGNVCVWHVCVWNILVTSKGSYYDPLDVTSILTATTNATVHDFFLVI